MSSWWLDQEFSSNYQQYHFYIGFKVVKLGEECILIYIEAVTQKALRMNTFRIGSLRQLTYWSSRSLWLLARGANAFETCSVSAPEMFWDVGWMW